jgi:hypothetical protein
MYAVDICDFGPMAKHGLQWLLWGVMVKGENITDSTQGTEARR